MSWQLRCVGLCRIYGISIRVKALGGTLWRLGSRLHVHCLRHLMPPAARSTNTASTLEQSSGTPTHYYTPMHSACITSELKQTKTQHQQETGIKEFTWCCQVERRCFRGLQSQIKSARSTSDLMSDKLYYRSSSWTVWLVRNKQLSFNCILLTKAKSWSSNEKLRAPLTFFFIYINNVQIMLWNENITLMDPSRIVNQLFIYPQLSPTRLFKQIVKVFQQTYS